MLLTNIFKSNKIVLCGIFAALTGVGAMISVPIGQVPINMVHIAIFLSAMIIGPKLAMVSQIVYILMGMVGLPVFSGFAAGLGHILGPTGGFIWSYPIVAFVSAYLFRVKKMKPLVKVAVGILNGWIITYVVGTVYYCVITDLSVNAALVICIVPFLLGDICKSVAAYILIMRLTIIH